MTETSVCQGCGTSLHGRKTKWCNGEACRSKARRSSTSASTNLDGLLREVEDFITRHVHFTSEASTACTLWTAHTHTFRAASVTPYLAITSPEKGSGKTRLLEVLDLIAREPWLIASLSAAALFRLVGSERVTLLIDETDAIFKEHSVRNEELRALLNAGYRKSGKVARVEGGRKGGIVKYSVFCPKALAGIDSLPDTIADRSITIRLERRTDTEWVTRWRNESAAEEAEPIRKKLHAWADSDAIRELSASLPDVPKMASDRQAEVWEPLLAIADMAGGNWPEAARMAALSLETQREDSESVTVLLLRHTRDILSLNGGTIPTSRLLSSLVDKEDGPWARFWGRALNAHDTKGPASSLAKMFSRHNIRPREIPSTLEDYKSGPQMGYYAEDFEEAFRRYLPPS